MPISGVRSRLFKRSYLLPLFFLGARQPSTSSQVPTEPPSTQIFSSHTTRTVAGARPASLPPEPTQVAVKLETETPVPAVRLLRVGRTGRAGVSPKRTLTLMCIIEEAFPGHLWAMMLQDLASRAPSASHFNALHGPLGRRLATQLHLLIEPDAWAGQRDHKADGVGIWRWLTAYAGTHQHEP